MKVTQEEERECQVVLNIEVEHHELDKYLDRAYRRVVQRLTIPGFRKGKAPRSVVESFAGREALLNEALDFLVPEVTSQAIKDNGLSTSAQPRVEMVKLEPVTLKATVALRPQVELGDYRSLRLQPESVAVSEEQVDQALEQIRHTVAPWEPVEHPVESDDLLTIDVTGKVEGRSVISSKGLQYRPSTNPAMPVPGFGDALVGASKGETREFDLLVPQDYSDRSIAGKLCKFSVSIKEIKQKKLQELNDELAKGAGEGFESLEALRDKVRENLQKDAERAEARRFQDQALKLLIETGVKLTLPSILVDEEIHHILREEEDAMASQRITMEQYLAKAGKTGDELHEELRPRAIERLTHSLVLSKMAESEGIRVEDGDIDLEIESMVTGVGSQEGTLRQLLGDPRRRECLAVAIRNQKALERIAAIAKGELTLEAPATTGEVQSEKVQPIDVSQGGDRND